MTERTHVGMPTVIGDQHNLTITQYSFSDIERMAQAVAKSGMFGMKTQEQAIALMMLAQAEGMHPMVAARDYDIIQGRPSKKAEAMLRDFQRAGGSVQWHELSDTVACATFSHPHGGSVKIDWTMDRAKKAGMVGKDMWTKFPRQMLRSRCVSEGCKTVWPSATSGMYTPEETQEFQSSTVRDVTPTPDINKRLQALTEAIDTPQPAIKGKKQEKAIDVLEQPLKWIWIAPDSRFRSYDNSGQWLEALRAGLPAKSADECSKLMSRMNDTFNELRALDNDAVSEAQEMINGRFIEATDASMNT